MGKQIILLSQNATRDGQEVTHCPDCHAKDKSECIVSAAKEGQRPHHFGMSDAMEPFTPGVHEFVLGLRRPTVFNSTAYPWFIPPHEDVLRYKYPNAVLAAAAYAGKAHLDVRNFNLFATSQNPTARLLLDIIDGKEISPFIRPWLRLFNPLLTEIRQTVTDHNIRDRLKLASYALLRRNAQVIGAFNRDYARHGHNGTIGKQHVFATFLDLESQRLRVIDPKATLLHTFRDNTGCGVDLPHTHDEAPLARIHSCCDSRGDGHRPLATNRPGELQGHNIISVIIPSHEQALQSPNSTWPFIVGSLAHNAENLPEDLLVPHSKCGGMLAGLEMLQNNSSLGSFLDLWLMQAKRQLREVLDFGRTQGIEYGKQGGAQDDLILANLAAKWVAVSGAKNIEAYSGRNVDTIYLDILTRSMTTFDPHQPIAEIFADQGKIIVPGPHRENFDAPPISCPKRNHGERAAHPSSGNMRYALSRAEEVGCWSAHL